MRIAVIVEGKTEQAFKVALTRFFSTRLIGRMPKLNFIPQDGRVPKEQKLRRLVANLLIGREAYDAVIALTDVYTGTQDFADAADAKQKMRDWVGAEDRFYPHAAQHDFEAWLLPFWNTIQKLAKRNQAAPGGNPESVNHNRPPSVHIKEIFERGGCRDSYSKTRDARKILENNDLAVAAAACGELRSFLNTIIQLCGGELLT